MYDKNEFFHSKTEPNFWTQNAVKIATYFSKSAQKGWPFFGLKNEAVFWTHNRVHAKKP